MDADRMLTEKQVAALLGVSQHCLRAWRWRAKNRGPRYVKMESSIRYRESDVKAYLERCLSPAPPESAPVPALWHRRSRKAA